MRSRPNTVRDWVGGAITKSDRPFHPLHIRVFLRRIRGGLPWLIAGRVDAARNIVPSDTTDVWITDDESILALRNLKGELLFITCCPGPGPFSRHIDPQQLLQEGSRDRVVPLNILLAQCLLKKGKHQALQVELEATYVGTVGHRVSFGHSH